MQRVKVQLYTGTCTPLTHAHTRPPIPAAGYWLSCSPPRGPPQWGTRVSPSLITPLTPACQVCTPSSFLIRYCSFISVPIHLPSYFPSLGFPPSLLPVCHPGRAVPPQLCPPGLCPLPWVPCGGKARALSPCLDPDTNHKGRELNDGFSKCAYWL